ncbi:hypothetical protein D1632_00090 [Chryseobacterium nematophagum]|uniref:Uncharacterized protein n=1 Tax=Chryseobacterium nematophagum TaxID=2305228 RepID=A0A3M7LGK7_9FLAO|nr:hypothetical protein [Chryseobacterium nematophagum]RMZ61254.1 hypothetical protein D1632_00555 [Chryseobacterium nematophagum]RMZ61261.1 hypothetical protein D1632_00160 [Chryseobacterium nematophagum]RMZ61330.1 hypothetical protein D1632_00090 [Chryseobacterium nematophagum]
MKYSTKITYKIYDPNSKKYEDPEWQNLADNINNNMLQAFTSSIQKKVLKYNRILRGCHIEFILDLTKAPNNGFKPVINILYIPEKKIKIVKLVLNLILESKEEELTIQRQKKFN